MTERNRMVRGIVLSNRAPGEARAWLNDALAELSDDELGAQISEQAVILISELVADAVDHGSDEATIRLSIDDETVCIELYDGPRRSLIALSGRDEGVPTFRRRLFRRLSDGWSSEDLGDGHLARCEIRRHPPSPSTDDRS
jgi:anti-sigma regulatory factor (Ser/Thr protein kinase)